MIRVARLFSNAVSGLVFKTLLALIAILVVMESPLSAAEIRKAMNLTTYQNLGFTVDPTTVQGLRVREILAQIQALGFNHITFNVRAKMVTGTANEVTSFVPRYEQADEEQKLEETIRYAQSLGFTCGVRPILLVVGPRGEFPYVKNGVTWWHGLIEPTDSTKWFSSLRTFHERYLKLAARTGLSQYTIGAELHSMTTGLGERRPRRPRGYPRQWTEFVTYAKSIAGPQTQITYDINFTDQNVFELGVKKLGGEFEQFRWEVTREVKKPADVQFQSELREFWKSLDHIGLDMYRSLASARVVLPKDFAALSLYLRNRADSYATQLDTGLLEIEVATGVAKNVELKEIGYRSVEGSFINPAAYESAGGRFSILHQAAAWDALLSAFLTPSWPWFRGVHVWETNVDRSYQNARDLGFSPLGKPESEAVFSRFF